MVRKLKDYYSKEYIECLADAVFRYLGEFDKKNFVSAVMDDGWETLELKERMSHISGMLKEFLPDDYEKAVWALKKAIAHLDKRFKYYDMLNMCFPDYVEKYGMDAEKWDISLDALEYFTHNGTSSELAIRPFIIERSNKVMKWMTNLAKHPHHHVRRFASEGCRPRLPWAMALPNFKNNPQEVMEILEILRADESKFVQKSVANNLNDISKDNPEAVVDFVRRYKESCANTNWIAKHGCRTMLKQGRKDVLEMFGFGNVEVVEADLFLDNDVVVFGNNLYFTFKVIVKDTDGISPVNQGSGGLRFEYAIDFVKANGKSSQKVFQITGGNRTGEDGKCRVIEISKKHPFVDMTTRKHYAGEHKIHILVNGKVAVSKCFDLKM